MISTVYFAIAAVPVAMYLILIGSLWLRSRPLVTTGWRDMLALGIAASGLVAIGPMELFFPRDAAAFWHGWVWLALFALYMLILMLIILSCRPRFIAYGMNGSEFRATLLEAARRVDPGARWDGEVLNLPGCGIQLAVEPTGTADVYQVASVGSLYNLAAWLTLEREFVKASSTTRRSASRIGVPLILLGFVLLFLAVVPLVIAPADALAQLKEFLNR